MIDRCLARFAPPHILCSLLMSFAFGQSIHANTLVGATGFSLQVRSDGALYGWGKGAGGELGTGSTANSATPSLVRLPAGVTAIAIAAASGQSLAVGSDGNAYIWGLASSGDGSGSLQGATPVAVTLPTGVRALQVAAGGRGFQFVQGSNGTLYAWGINFSGALGIGFSPVDGSTYTSVSNLTPVVLPTGVSVATVSAGWLHTLAIGSDGNLYAWGNNEYGELCDGTLVDSKAPFALTLPNSAKPVSVAAGHGFSVVAASDGSVYACGYNGNGELGNGTVLSSSTFTAVSIPSDVSVDAVSANGAGNYALAHSSDGRLYAWGANDRGQLGDLTLINQSTPVVVQLATGVRITGFSAGATHSLAVTSDGTLYAWGDNQFGSLGDGAFPKPIPQALTLNNISNQAPNYYQIDVISSSRLPVTFKVNGGNCAVVTGVASCADDRSCTYVSVPGDLSRPSSCTIEADQAGGPLLTGGLSFASASLTMTCNFNHCDSSSSNSSSSSSSSSATSSASSSGSSTSSSTSTTASVTGSSSSTTSSVAADRSESSGGGGSFVTGSSRLQLAFCISLLGLARLRRASRKIHTTSRTKQQRRDFNGLMN